MTATAGFTAAEVFARIDAMDVGAFAEFFTERAELVFGNNDPLVGPAEIRTGTQRFFDTIAGLHHTILHEWNPDAHTIVQLEVTYHGRDGRQVTIPAVCIWHRTEGDRIDDYRVYYDLAPLYA